MMTFFFLYSWRLFCSVYFFLLFGLVMCSHLDHGPLIDQEMRFREGYKGLTHTTCLEVLEGSCLSQNVVEYSFENPEHLKRLRAVNLTCKVGETRFYICPDKAALCSNSEEMHTFLGIPLGVKIMTEEILVPQEVQMLIDTGTYCAAQGSITEQTMF